MVLQETWLFDGSIYDNLTYGNKNTTKGEVEKVLEKARLSSFLTNYQMVMILLSKMVVVTYQKVKNNF